MKGVILAGGTGSRLLPLTKVTNKHLLPVYNKPMIYYPIEFFRDSGITDIMIILGGNSVGDFVNLLGDGGQFSISITYRYQHNADGIAGALKLARDFCGEQPFVVCLGDNIFGEPIPELHLRVKEIESAETPSGIICIHPTDRPNSFGVPTFDGDSIVKITEKPANPDSNYAVTGLYVYDKNIWLMIDSLVPSARGELEITDINNWYISNGKLEYIKLNSWWHDAGSIQSLFKVSQLVMEKEKMLNDKKVILTGGCGFIGNTMSKLLLESNLKDFVVIDKISYVSNDEFHYKNKIKVLKEDIQSEAIYNFILDYKPEVIINMAAESHVDVSIKNPNLFLQANVFGTVNLLNASLKLSEQPLFVQISTDEVYGDVAEGWSKESDPRVTSSPYSASKASAELFVESYGRTYGLPYFITRSSNNYGPYQNEEKLIPKIINNILAGRKVPVYGDGKQERDWIFVDDNCSAILHLINEYRGSDVYNVGGLETTNNLEIIKQICLIMNKDENDFIEFVKDRPGHDRRYAISIDKIKNRSGWKPTTDLNTGLIKTINWVSSRNG